MLLDEKPMKQLLESLNLGLLISSGTAIWSDPTALKMLKLQKCRLDKTLLASGGFNESPERSSGSEKHVEAESALSADRSSDTELWVT